MITSSSLLILTALLPYFIQGGSISSRACENIAPIAGFNLSNYLGRWYEQYRDLNIPFEQGRECVVAKYTNNTTPNGFNIVNSQYNPSTKQLESIEGRAECEKSTCAVKFEGVPQEGQYIVVDTDYTTYAIVYSC